MRIPAAATVAAFLALHTGCLTVPAATIRSPYTHISGGNANERIFELDGSLRGMPSRPSYVIYDYDVNAVQNNRDRPQILSRPRPWHLEFNNQHSRSPQGQPTHPPDAFSSVHSNLIQVYDSPQRKYYGPYDTKSYLEPDRGFYNYPRETQRPSEVPYYDVVYPYDNRPKNQFYGHNLPDRFPTTFMPEKNFQVKEPVPYEGPKDMGFYRTQTVNYFGYNGEGSEERRGRRKEQCNYIKLNEKGFPLGNELCGRSISDVLLAPDYPITADLYLEHRKRYRGSYTGRSLNLTDPIDTSKETHARRRRAAQDYSRSLSRCCSDHSPGYGYYPSRGFGYGYSSFGHDNRGSEYHSYRPGDSNYGYGGQYQDNYSDDYGDETSDYRGLSTYMSNSDRGRFHESENDGRGDSRQGSYNYRRNSTRNQNSNDRGNGSSSDGSSVNSRDYGDDRRNDNNHGTTYNGYSRGDGYGGSSGNRYYSSGYDRRRS